MGLFSRKVKFPRNARFSESYFQEKIKNYLWADEPVLCTEIVVEGNDPPLSGSGFSSSQKQETTRLLAGHDRFLLCVSPWRLLIGYPSGAIASHAFQECSVTVFQDENGTNVVIKSISNSSDQTESFIVSETLVAAIQQNQEHKIPDPGETMIFIDGTQRWDHGVENAGQKLLADLAASRHGSAHTKTLVCSECGFTVFPIESYPETFFLRCHECLRQNRSIRDFE